MSGRDIGSGSSERGRRTCGGVVSNSEPGRGQIARIGYLSSSSMRTRYPWWATIPGIEMAFFSFALLSG